MTRAGRPPAASSKPGRRPRTRPPSTGSISSRPVPYYPPSQTYPQGYPQQGQYPGQAAPYGQPPGQYGQPGQPVNMVSQDSTVSQVSHGQPGQYPQPGQYGQYGAPYGQPPAGPKRSKKTIGTVLGLLAAAIVAVILVLGFWAPGFFVTTKLDVSKAQAGVQQILTDNTNGYGAKNVKDVKCNNGQNPTVKKGATFDCDVSIDGTKRSVTVTFQDNKGTYEVGRPK